REIVLAAPVTAHEMPALEHFVATHNIAVTIPGGQSATGRSGSWTHLAPTDPAGHRSDTITTPAPALPPAAAAGVREARPHPAEETASARGTRAAASAPHTSHPTTPADTVDPMTRPPDTGLPTNTAARQTENIDTSVGTPGIMDGVTGSAAAGDRSTVAGPHTAALREVVPGPGVPADGVLAPKAIATVAVTADAVMETLARPVDSVREPSAGEPVLSEPREELPTVPAAQSHETSAAHTPAGALLHGGPQDPTTTSSDHPLKATQPTATAHDRHSLTTNHPAVAHYPAPGSRDGGSVWQPAVQGATGHAGTLFSAEHRRLNDDLLGLPSMDNIVRTLGKLPEQEYQHLMSRTDRLVAAPVLIGTDPATARERALREEDRQRVAFVLRRDGEDSARNLAKNLGVIPGPGLRGGFDAYSHQYGSESEGDDHAGNSQTYQHYIVRDDDDLLYRNDSRHPDEIFEAGFQARIPESNVTLMDHVWTGPNHSQWVSTSRRDDLWRFGGYHYEIDAPGQGVDVEMTYGDDYPHLVREEEEVAFEGGIDRSFIIGADEQPIPGYGSGNFRVGDESGSFYFVNPHFEFPVGGHQVGWNQNSDSDED
ncbi:scabin-related ADP-ribosyltransferase, partial [Kitasatospora indigofera]|uniref:scabin-related ADP-ribosyltransferase n=1 Tax=Kitasatospora indigofera TaxID=67307 RepID=UPI00348DB712